MENNNLKDEDKSDQYFLSKLRDKLINTECDVLMEKSILNESRQGRIDHLEDLVLTEGLKGLQRSFEILKSFVDNKFQTTLKFDGSPCVVFGRDDNGQFILTDKSGFQATTYNGKAKSRNELFNILSNRNQSLDTSRRYFIANMCDIFDEYQKATPKDFRGFLIGDLLYYNTPELKNNCYEFKPNVVNYSVEANSKLGKRIGQSKTGIVVHKYLGDKFQSINDAITSILGQEVFIIPPVYVQHSSIDTESIKKLENYMKKYHKQLGQLFLPNNLKGIGNIHSLFYKYINNKVDTGMVNLGDDFSQWINTEHLSHMKLRKISEYLENNKVGVNALWKLISGLMKIKDQLILNLNKNINGLNQSINGNPGGEGYVVNHPEGAVKLVSRNFFTVENRKIHR